jgi:hypothetical protein
VVPEPQPQFGLHAEAVHVQQPQGSELHEPHEPQVAQPAEAASAALRVATTCPHLTQSRLCRFYL